MITSNVDHILRLAKNFEEKTKNKYVYHIKSTKFKGKYIYPLSELENYHPNIYKKEIKKYKGRESHPEIKINLLNAKWKDCVNFSTINPIKIFQLEELLGIPGYKNGQDVDIFRFNIKDLKDFDMCLYDDNKSPRKDEAYKKININNYKETQFVPVETVKYFIKSKEENEYPLLFGHVIHLLVNDAIPINKADIIKFEANVFK